MPKKYRVGILGATGTVGQRFAQLLEDHPQFEITAMAASDRSAGKRYAEACAWKLPGQIPASVRDIIVQPIEPPLEATESTFATSGAERSIVYGPPVVTAPQLPARSTAQTWKYQVPAASGGELAERCGLTRDYVAAINRGVACVPLKGPGWSVELDTSRTHTCDAIWDAVCKAASAELTDGKELHGLDWWKEQGLRTNPFSQLDWYLLPTLQRQGLRFELPYQERLKRVGVELGRPLVGAGEHGEGPRWQSPPPLPQERLDAADLGREVVGDEEVLHGCHGCGAGSARPNCCAAHSA